MKFTPEELEKFEKQKKEMLKKTTIKEMLFELGTLLQVTVQTLKNIEQNGNK